MDEVSSIDKWINFWSILALVCGIGVAIATYKIGYHNGKKNEKQFHNASEERATFSQELNKKIDEASLEIDSIVTQIDSAAKLTIEEIEINSNKANEALEDLKAKSTVATSKIQNTVSKIDSVTNRLQNNLLYKNAILRIRYSIPIHYEKGINRPEDLKKLLETFVNDFTYTLKISQPDNGTIEYAMSNRDFIYSSKEGGEKNLNAYHIPYEQDLFTSDKESLVSLWDFFVTYKFEMVNNIDGNIKIEKGNSVKLFCDPVQESLHREDFKYYHDIKVNYAFFQINGQEFNLDFHQFLPNSIENRYIDIVSFGIK